MAVSLEAYKWISAGLVGVLTLVGSLLPMCIRAQKWTARFESLAGGVFLGAGFAHLLEDSTAEIAQYGKIKYPISGALAISTFVILTTIEIFSYSERDLKEDNEKDESHLDSQLTDMSETEDPKPINEKESHKSSEQRREVEKVPTKLFRKKFYLLSIPATSLYLILDVHSVIEGLALGIMNSKRGVVALACAVGGHKPVEGFALGLIILKCRPTKWLYWLMMIFYVLMSPIGTIIAIYLSKSGDLLLLGILSAISAGTFTFVGCDEWSQIFLNKQTWSYKEKFWHLGLFILGILWMLLIAIAE
ncbi:ZIP Zinc transporter family protein [Tritrichomonas foetus]|uniref:ZIP Zinc transporter family protein n=1 Tax=Tritrichomonas foetus TaxID=1144522 RepID=A0A1J4JTP2_9EUKA|nr:ZIP Zinc transporter family protein [Tritrichomonas foetus]|eukprot:OHT00868.1 ZIP Zinc transporter family protein [Tritrichomonas foetus]